MPYALIYRGRVVETKDEPFTVCPEMTWVEIAEDLDPQPEVGWTYAEETFTGPVLRTRRQNTAPIICGDGATKTYRCYVNLTGDGWVFQRIVDEE